MERLTAMRFFTWTFVLLGLLVAGLPARAEETGATAPLLTISGRITHAGADGRLVLDANALAALPRQTVTAETPWTEGPTTFEGVSLKAVLDLAGAEGSQLHAIALNDYAVDIPIADADDPRIIIADTMNGTKLRVRDFGPLWIVYPLSDDAAYRNEATYSKMIWQLNRIEIR